MTTTDRFQPSEVECSGSDLDAVITSIESRA
jgi:hypothetical protein